ncbi:hypothetical protein [uncultured Tateyamaria sp.]|uniref:hypothetical protein n=1 Tax=Tateyamaria sp. 1078 TaxID=3417464 RepID=UPI0026166008|nr:hypothetical protein [uncultured Tateyamaria sp.]
MPITLTTVVDDHPRFWCEFVLWLLCANARTAMAKRVYFTCTPPAGLVAFANARGCDIRRADRLIAASPHCNKLIPFLDPTAPGDQIVTDSDVFLTGDLQPFLRPDRVRLPPNNHGNPPLAIFREVFAAAGLRPPEPGVALFTRVDGQRETFGGNVSAGVIAIPAAHRDLAHVWHKWALWLVERTEMLGRFAVHVDQVSFALAMQETDVRFQFLPPQANAVLQILPEITDLHALHLTSGHIPQYPQWFAADGTLKADAINPALADPIARYNLCVREANTVIATIPELAAFAENFLNPAYRRDG